jgi:hypothetical protein
LNEKSPCASKIKLDKSEVLQGPEVLQNELKLGRGISWSLSFLGRALNFQRFVWCTIGSR